MTTGSLTILALLVMVPALIGGWIGGWIGGRKRSATPNILHRLNALYTLLEQSAKGTREEIEALRKAMTDTALALGSKVDEGLRAGFDQLLATIAEGVDAPTTQIDIFHAEIAAVSDAMTKLGSDVSVALETARAKARLDAIDVSKLLLTGLSAGLHRRDLKIEAFGAKVEEFGTAIGMALGDFQTLLTGRLDEVRLAVARIGGEMTSAGIQGIVDQKLQEGIDQRMNETFARIAVQFAEVQQAVSDVKTVAGQLEDLKRLLANANPRGGRAEAPVKATVDDIMPPGSYESTMRIDAATADTV